MQVHVANIIPYHYHVSDAVTKNISELSQVSNHEASEVSIIHLVTVVDSGQQGFN